MATPSYPLAFQGGTIFPCFSRGTLLLSFLFFKGVPIVFPCGWGGGGVRAGGAFVLWVGPVFLQPALFHSIQLVEALHLVQQKSFQAQEQQFERVP